MYCKELNRWFNSEPLSPFLIASYKKLFKPEVCDFEVKTKDDSGEDVILKVRSRNLIRESLYFKKMFKKNTKEAREKSVTISDFSPRVVNEMLRFTHYFHVEGFDEICRVLIYAARKYQIPYLEYRCIVNICLTLSTGNVLESLTISHHFDMTCLFRRCIEMIIK